MTLKTGFFLKSLSIVAEQLWSPGRNEHFLYRGILDRMEKYAQGAHETLIVADALRKKKLNYLQISVTYGTI